MRTRTRRTMVVLMVLAAMVATVPLFAMTGRDVAAEGRLATLSGDLLSEDNEWFLVAPDGRYEIHLGPLGHEGTLPFADGTAATLRGFVLPEHIAPITVSADGQSFEFWHEERYPLWAGSGDRKNAVDDDRLTETAPRLSSDRSFRNQDSRPGRGR
jgi:hypothetical protein